MNFANVDNDDDDDDAHREIWIDVEDGGWRRPSPHCHDTTAYHVS